MTKPPFDAIPTIYLGVSYRSRLEALTAMALTKLGIAFEYELQSFLLAGGVFYRPDFWLPAFRLWLECRGYTSEKGEAQLARFPAAMASGDFFAVIRPPEQWIGPKTPNFRFCRAAVPLSLPDGRLTEEAEAAFTVAVDVAYLLVDPNDDSRVGRPRTGWSTPLESLQHYERESQ